MSKNQEFILRVSPDDSEVAYLQLPGHPGIVKGAVAKNIRLRDLLGDYEGPDLYFDFTKENRLIGVEVID